MPFDNVLVSIWFLFSASHVNASDCTLGISSADSVISLYSKIFTFSTFFAKIELELWHRAERVSKLVLLRIDSIHHFVMIPYRNKLRIPSTPAA